MLISNYTTKHFQKISKVLAGYFGTQSLNIRILEKDQISGQYIDQYLNRYGDTLSAFVKKRRIKRNQIWPKIHIIDPLVLNTEKGQTNLFAQEQTHLNYQKLYPLKKSMKETIMKTIADKDPEKINSSYIISMFCEDYFKEMMDEYVEKVLICGKAPNDEKQYNKVQEEVMKMYKMFYEGEPVSHLEKEIQFKYLVQKQHKFLRYSSQNPQRKNQYQKCIWTQQDQRILQDMQNWRPQDSSVNDINNRAIFLPLEIKQKLKPRIRSQELINAWNFFQRWQFDFFTKAHYMPATKKYFDWVSGTIFSRIIHYIKSTEYTNCLNIPHDYMIESQMLQIHFWLVIDRLKKFDTMESRNLALMLDNALKFAILREAKSVNLKKTAVLTANLSNMLQMNAQILDIHFNRSPVTKDNLYKGIDAMVWSIAYAQKVHRFSQQVYRFGDYLIKNYLHLQHHTEKDFFNAIIEFDPYLINSKCMQEICLVNPKLSQEEFEKQFNVDSEKKDYYYSKIQEEMNLQMPLEQGMLKKNQQKKFTISEFMQPFYRIKAKYFSLKTMDHYNRMEQLKKKSDEIDKQSAWKTDKDEINQINKEFQNLNAIRYQIKKEKRKK